MKWTRALDGTDYMPGLVGLNNMKNNDYVNVAMQILARVGPIRDFFLIPANYAHCKSVLVQRFGELLRKIWHPRNFKGQVSLSFPASPTSRAPLISAHAGSLSPFPNSSHLLAASLLAGDSQVWCLLWHTMSDLAPLVVIRHV